MQQLLQKANKLSLVLLIGASSIASTTDLVAEVVIEKYQRFEIDWTNLKIRSFGEAKPTKEGEEYSQLQTLALEEGLGHLGSHFPTYIREAVLRDSPELAPHKQFANAGFHLARRTYYYSTEIHHDRKVRLLLESSLPAAFKKTELLQSKTNSPNPGNFQTRATNHEEERQHPKLLFVMDKDTRPMPFYVIRNTEGQVVLSQKEIDDTEYAGNLMGRWYRQSKDQSFKKRFGSNPIMLDLKTLSIGEYQVDSTKWSELIKTHGSIRKSSRIALLLP